MEVSVHLHPAPDITGLSASSSSVQFGTSVNLTCSFTATSALYSVEWFVNGNLRQTTTLSGNETQDVFVVDRFSEDGVYQCRVFSGNRDNSIEGVFISGRGVCVCVVCMWSFRGGIPLIKLSSYLRNGLLY